MNILILNCGSSSLKFQIINTDSEKISTNSDIELAKGLIEKVGTDNALISFKSTTKDNDNPGNTNIYKTEVSAKDHKEAIEWIMK
jgi:acetate kinase